MKIVVAMYTYLASGYEARSTNNGPPLTVSFGDAIAYARRALTLYASRQTDVQVEGEKIIAPDMNFAFVRTRHFGSQRGQDLSMRARNTCEYIYACAYSHINNPAGAIPASHSCSAEGGRKARS